MTAVLDQFEALRLDVRTRHGRAAAASLAHVFTITEAAQRDQVRYSGDPYVTHSLTVAAYVTQWGLAPVCIEAALGHDLRDEPTWTTLQRELAPSVAQHIEAVYCLNSRTDLGAMLTWPDPNERRFAADVLTIKIADRLHNARTWEFVPQAKARFRASETINRVAPTAGRLGLHDVDRELRELSYEILNIPLQPPSRGTVPGALLSQALSLIPRQERARRRYEWLSDLSCCTAPGDRRQMAIGFVYSAIAIRLQSMTSSI